LSQWQLHGLPDDLSGKTFIDVGCWEGHICVEAMKRNAAVVLGLDYCTSPDLRRNLEKFGFSFIQLDILSEKVLELPEFDVVHCAGVLYHVENPLSFLFRLRKLCHPDGWLYVETACYVPETNLPVMLFHPDNSRDDNPSNWWSPNEQCLHEMLRAVGFSEIEVTFKNLPNPATPPPIVGRIGMKGHATNTAHNISQKLLPRRPSFMPQSPGLGNRSGVGR